MKLWFRTSQKQTAGALEIFLAGSSFYFYPCSSSWTKFPSDLPSYGDMVWRITIDKTAGMRIIIHYRNEEVLDVQLADICSFSDWRSYWIQDVEYIYFPNQDAAAEYYKFEPIGTGSYTEFVN